MMETVCVWLLSFPVQVGTNNLHKLLREIVSQRVEKINATLTSVGLI